MTTSRVRPTRRVPWRAAAFVAAGLASVAGLAGCSGGDVRVGAGHARRGGITLGVGSVQLGRGATVGGAIVIKAGQVEALAGARVRGRVAVNNGNVELGDSTQVAAIEVGSGMIRVGRGAVVAGPIRLTAGLIELDGARVDGLVTLARGRLEALPGALLGGGLRVESPGLAPHDSTYVVIKAGAAVRGTVAVIGRARLIVEAGADTAGARFTGVAPEPRE